MEKATQQKLSLLHNIVIMQLTEPFFKITVGLEDRRVNISEFKLMFKLIYEKQKSNKLLKVLESFVFSSFGFLNLNQNSS